ncbi:hypothetical protein C7N43_34815 [Sphingobacteriales bacterium UPWRP_1]|nr:hypothetical protein B6N25_00895 [Sphingobacteriales bacterium TSM_CSS]PSJ72331.1 hypothetical protein C7N43_34815 [Sphingobacteriales bacterium UPWRP_1]
MKLEAQMPLITVADLTLKIPAKGEEILYYGFAQGDEILFSFREEEGRELTEVAVEEYPGNTRFADYKTAGVKNKSIQVTKKGVYVFRFNNKMLLKGRVCRILIQRVPATDQTTGFNTKVEWMSSFDTTYRIEEHEILMGYDTIYTREENWEFKKSAQEEMVVFDKTQRVFAKTSLTNDNRTCLRIDLPPDTETKAKTRRLTGWAYWIGVGEEAGQAWSENVKMVGSFAQGVIALYSPLGGLVAGLVSNLAIPKTGEDVYYCVLNAENAGLFLQNKAFVPLDWGKGTGGYGKFTANPQSTFYICLENDNYLQAIDVAVKVAAIADVKEYFNKERTKQVINPRMQTTRVEEPIITPVTIPVTAE